MEALTEKLTNLLLPISNALNNNKHLTAVKNAMMFTIPFMIVGGIFCLLAQPPVPSTLEPTNFFYSFLLSWKAWATANGGVLLPVFNLTINFIAVYVAFGVAYEFAKDYAIDKLAAGFCSLFIFFLTSAAPFTDKTLGTIISCGNLGGVGMFYAIIVAFVVCEIYRFCKVKNFKIKLPEQVPPNVSAPFEALIPFTISTLLFLVLNIISLNVMDSNLCKLIYAIIQPLLSASGSLPSVIMISILLSLFWFMGIHGNNLVGSVLTPITTANLAINAQFIMTGQGSPTPLAGAFMTIFGNWMSYPAMMLVFFLVAKSAQLKSLRKLALVPDLFNINEPLTFGVPIVMNVLLALPIMICNVIMCTAAYLLMDSGIVGSIYISLPFTCPGILNLFLSTGDVKTIFMWLIMFAVDVVILFPFVKMYDKQLLKEENASIDE